MLTGPTLAILSAFLFGASTPLAKLLLGQVDPWLLAWDCGRGGRRRPRRLWSESGPVRARPALRWFRTHRRVFLARALLRRSALDGAAAGTPLTSVVGGGSPHGPGRLASSDRVRVNQWAADQTRALAGGTPILALDMYEQRTVVRYRSLFFSFGVFGISLMPRRFSRVARSHGSRSRVRRTRTESFPATLRKAA